MKPNDEEFFEKYGFTLTISKKHPIYNDSMTFEGLEADYVSSIERDLEHYKKAFVESMQNNERLTSKEYYRLQNEIKKLEFKDK